MLSSLQFATAVFITFTFEIMDSDAFLNKNETITEYKDVFIGSLGRKPQLSTTSASCWARGGICMHIRFCVNHEMVFGVPGCSTRFKVCCKNFKRLPPTVGIQRSRDEYAEIENEDGEDINYVPRAIVAFKI
ncbi:uncharacterized protein LOC123864211 [Maniola jurtina]|uniref:uncharacterized protein LOC123864211 n=1 Tax=Maniola jurtina TaxID=191418 RepID=UPI001E68DCBE|nr:uncharacterized protein LOC123864211 [Maniola jurtina]